MDYSELMQKFSLPQDYVDMQVEQFEFLDDEISIPTEVCHYTRKEVALEKILKSKKIRLGNITSTNDPKESKQRLIIYLDGPMSSIVRPQSRKEWSTLTEWRVFCTSCHNNPSLEFMNANPSQEYEHERYGMSHSSMWAHYAGNHSGVCLLFDGKKLNQNTQNELKDKQTNIFHGFVRYDYEKATAPTMVITSEGSKYEKPEETRESLIHYYSENFLYKSPDWKPEHEFRWLVQSQDTSEIFISIENAIKAVIVGADFDDIYEPSLIALCKPLGIPAGRISWTSGRPYVERYSIYKP
jgi:hypothetical protein